MQTIKISSKGQLVLPKKIRTQLNIQSGTFLDIRIENKAIVLSPREKGPLASLYGRFKGESILDELEKEHEDEIENQHRA